MREYVYILEEKTLTEVKTCVCMIFNIHLVRKEFPEWPIDFMPGNSIDPKCIMGKNNKVYTIMPTKCTPVDL